MSSDEEYFQSKIEAKSIISSYMKHEKECDQIKDKVHNSYKEEIKKNRVFLPKHKITSNYIDDI